MSVHVLPQELLDAAFGLCDIGGKGDHGAVEPANVLHRARLRRIQARARLTHDGADQVGDQLAYELSATPDVVEIRVMPADLGDDVRRERHHLEIVDGKQSGAQAVIDVVGIVGDVVGDGRDLCLDRGKTPELQIVLFDVIGDADGDAVLV